MSNNQRYCETCRKRRKMPDRVTIPATTWDRKDKQFRANTALALAKTAARKGYPDLADDYLAYIDILMIGLDVDRYSAIGKFGHCFGSDHVQPSDRRFRKSPIQHYVDDETGDITAGQRFENPTLSECTAGFDD